MTIKESIKRAVQKLVQKVDNRNNLCNSSCDRTDKKKQRKMGFIKTFINIVHRFIVLIFRMLMQFLYGEKGQSMPPIKNLILMDSATTLAYKIRTRKITSVDVINAFISRIQEVNPILNCVVDERFADALKEAEKADALIASGVLSEDELAKEKPFLGVPITTKDCISVKGMLHTAGLYCRRNVKGEEDAEAMSLMRKAGAIPLALTNVSECCMWWESFNKIHGRTNNPYDTNRIVGGSSGGEGCLLGAAGSPFGLGSDIGGSIRMPAYFNGVFGHKPSKFIVSNHGQYPNTTCEEQNSFLTIGPMSRFAKDLKPVLKIIAGANAQFLDLDEPVNLTKLKYFYQESDGGGWLVSPVDSDIKEGIQRIAAHFKRTIKAETVKKVQIEKLRKSIPIWLANMKTKDAISFDRQLKNLEGKINPWIELLKCIFRQSEHTLVAILTAFMDNSGAPVGSPKHQYFLEQKKELLEEFKQMLGSDGVFIYPTHPTVAPYHHEPVVRSFNFGYTGIFNILGLPVTAVPLGLGREGLPIGVQVVANVNQDRLCLAVATELERAFGGWVAPELLA